MEEVSKEKNMEMKKGVKIALKTILDSFIVIMFAMCSIFVLFPKFSLKIHQTLGMDGMQELNYKMIYARSNKITDLYNLIIFEGSQNKYVDELAYIDQMLTRKDYSSFCETMDQASVNQINAEGLTSYSANVNGYVLSRKVVCMYELGKEGVDSYIYRQTNKGKLSEYSFSTYVDLIYFDEGLSQSQKSQKLNDLISVSDVFDGNLITLEDLVQTRVNGIIAALAIETDVNKKDVLKYTLMRIYASRYYVYDAIGEDDLKNANLSLYKEIKSELAK